MNKNLNKQVSEMSLTKAVEIALAGKAGNPEEVEQLLSAFAKLQTLATTINPALDNANTTLQKYAKKHDTVLEGSVNFYKRNSDGNTIPVELHIGIAPVDSIRETIDWGSLKADKGVDIVDDDNDPCVKHVVVGNPADWNLFKAPTLAGNPDAVKTAIASGSLDPKFSKQTVVSKYTVTIDEKEVTAQ